MTKRLGRAALMLAAGFMAGRGRARAEDTVSERLNRLAGTLTKEHDAKRPSNVHDSIAVFDFTASEKLTKERAGFAVSELILQKLVRTNAFTVVERSALQKVLDEQKLQKTDAIDPQTAVKVGRIVGAHLLLLGSIDKIGGTYQVNSRIVLVETGEVVAAGYEEFPKKAFEEEAAPYMALVPEEQAIGFYLAYDKGPYVISKQPATTLSGSVAGNAYSATLTPFNQPNEMEQLGIGVRYYPARKVMFDFALLAGNGAKATASTSKASLGGSSGAPDTNSAGAGGGAESKMPNFTIRGSLNRMFSLSQQFKVYGGAGVMLNTVDMGSGQDAEQRLYGGNVRVQKLLTTGDQNLVTPFLRAGLEWRPQPRLGFSFFGQYQIGGKSITREGTLTAANCSASGSCSGGAFVPATPADTVTVPVYKLAVPETLMEFTFSFYF